MVVSDEIAGAFNRSGPTRAVALDISKAFDRVWHAGLLHKLKSLCLLFFTIFKRQMYFFVISNKVHYKYINLQLFFLPNVA